MCMTIYTHTHIYSQVFILFSIHIEKATKENWVTLNCCRWVYIVDEFILEMPMDLQNKVAYCVR